MAGFKPKPLVSEATALPTVPQPTANIFPFKAVPHQFGLLSSVLFGLLNNVIACKY